MGLEAVGTQHPVHRGRGQRELARQVAHAPVRGARRGRLQGLGDDQLGRRLVEATGAPTTRPVDEAGSALMHERRAPLAHGRQRQAKLGGDLAVAVTLGGAQYDARPLGELVGGRRRVDRRLQLLTLTRGELDDGGAPGHANNVSELSFINK